MPCTLFSLLMLILFASISYYARSCGFEVYEKASILLLTSDYEGFPLTITESMNFGVIPIVYGSYSAAYDIISDNYSGMISKPNNGFDEEDFTNKLKMLLSSVTKRKDFSLNALNDSRRFLLNNIYEKWEKIL